MKKFIIDILIGVFKDPDVQAFVIKLAETLLDGVITKKLLPIFPFALGSAVKRFGQLIPGVENVGDAMAVANDIRDDLDKMVPDIDTGFKPLDDLMDIWRPKR